MAHVMIEAINVLTSIRAMHKMRALIVSPEAWAVPVVAEEIYQREAVLELVVIAKAGVVLRWERLRVSASVRMADRGTP